MNDEGVGDQGASSEINPPKAKEPASQNSGFWRAYQNLIELLNKARRAGLIRMEAIRDDGFISYAPPWFSGMDAFLANLAGDVGTEVSACAQATELAPDSSAAWARYAHALARTDRASDCLTACERALALRSFSYRAVRAFIETPNTAPTQPTLDVAHENLRGPEYFQ